MKINPKKSLGQNFLIDKNIIEKICNAANITRNDNVLEIGPGTGNLTDFILQKKPKKFHVIEKDEKLIKNLNIIHIILILILKPISTILYQNLKEDQQL
mgnify:CR=1 FL=1